LGNGEPANYDTWTTSQTNAEQALAAYAAAKVTLLSFADNFMRSVFYEWKNILGPLLKDSPHRRNQNTPIKGFFFYSNLYYKLNLGDCQTI